MTSEREPKAVRLLEAILLTSLAIAGLIFSNNAIFNRKPDLKIKNFIEAEQLKINGKSSNVFTQLQATGDFASGIWSKNGQLFGLAYEPGDWVEWTLTTNTMGKFRIDAYLTRSADYAIVQFWLDDEKLGEPIDLWSPRGPVTATGKITLGELDLKPGPHTLRLKIQGKNPGNTSSHYFFGIDGFVFEKI